MEKIRVLRVITWLPVGGIERKIVEVLPRLDRDRFEPSLVCLRERGPLADELEAAGIPVEVIPFRRRWDLGALRRLAALMKRRRIDLVHSHMYRSNTPATVAARWAGVRHVWGQIHNVDTWETGRQLSMDRFLCRWRDGMIAVSREVQMEVMDRLGLPESKVRLIYNGVDTQRFGTSEGREELREAWGAGPDDVVFLMAARLVDQKRPQDFIELARQTMAVESVARNRPRALFCVAGDGPKINDLKEQASKLPDPSRMIFLGQCDDIPRVMAASDVFVMTSTKEGFSNALVEALASGLAVIATRVGGNAEAVRDGQDGIIIQPNDREALFRSADTLVTQPERRERFKRRAKERAQAFSLDAMVRNVEALYSESCGR